MGSFRSLVAAALLATSCARPTPEQQIVNDAVAALGGEARLASARGLTLEGEATQYNLGQDVRPGAREQTFTVTELTRRIDLASVRARTEQTRTPKFIYFQGQAPQRQIQGIDGTVGYNIAATGTATRVADLTAQDRRAAYYQHPLTLLRTALAPGVTFEEPRTVGDERIVTIETVDGARFTLSIDGASLPSRIESRGYHPNLGDVTLSTLFADYQDVAGLRLPTRMTSKVDDFIVDETRVAGQRVDGELGDLSAPASAATGTSPPPPTVVVDVVAPGIWLLGGQSHHSVLVELSDRLMLIEAPQSEARTAAVIAKAREVRPGKRLTTLVTTHHHFDHTAGIRAAIAEGLAIITHSGNRSFVEEMARRRHSIVVDLLAKNPRTPIVNTVDEEMLIKDSLRTVGLYHVAGNPHSDTMLMVHFPAERVLVEVDAFSPGAAVNPYALNLLENITKRNLQVDRIVPLHGAIAPFADLLKLRTAQTN